MADTWTSEKRKKEILDYVNQGANQQDLYAAGYTDKELSDIGFEPTWSDEVDKADRMGAWHPGDKRTYLDQVSPENRPLSSTGAEDVFLGLDEVGRSRYQNNFGSEYTIEPQITTKRPSYTKAAGEALKEFGDWFTTPQSISGINSDVGNFLLDTGKAMAHDVYDPIKRMETGTGTVGDLINTVLNVAGGSAPKALGKGVDKDALGVFFSAPKDVAEKAQDMIDRGYSRKEVAMSEGVWQNPKTGDWVAETDDRKFGINPLALDYLKANGDGVDGTYETVLPHKELYRAFPKLKDKKTTIYTEDQATKAYNSPSTLGQHNPISGDLSLREGDEIAPTALHELQHAVDSLEGRETGTSVKRVYNDFYQTWENLPREAKNYLQDHSELEATKSALGELYTSRKELAEKKLLNFPFTAKQLDEAIADAEGDLLTYESGLTNLETHYPEFANSLKDLYSITQVAVPNEDLAYYAYIQNEGEDLANITMERKDLDSFQRLMSDPWEKDRGKTWTNDEFKRVLRTVQNHSNEYNNVPSTYKEMLNLPVSENTENIPRFAEGGVVEQDPISGNVVPPGSTPKEVRDDVDAKLSENEYVLPADVVKYFGLDYIEKLISKAKKGMEELHASGRIGGQGPDDLPFSPEELQAHETEMSSETTPAPVQMAEGGLVPSEWQITDDNTVDPITGLPLWMKKPVNKSVQNKQDFGMNNGGRQNDYKPQTGLAGSVDQWGPDDFLNYAKNKDSFINKGLETAIGAVVPFGGLLTKARHNYLDKNVPSQLDAMIESGVDRQGNPLSALQIASLKEARANLANGSSDTGIGNTLKRSFDGLFHKGVSPVKSSGMAGPSGKSQSSTQSIKSSSSKGNPNGNDSNMTKHFKNGGFVTRRKTP